MVVASCDAQLRVDAALARLEAEPDPAGARAQAEAAEAEKKAAEEAAEQAERSILPISIFISRKA
jgi:hypothetical protein